MKPHHQRPHLAWAIFLFCCLSLASAQPQKHIEISTLPFQESSQISPSGSRFYRINLANAPKDLDLLISVLPAWESAFTPKLFISHGQEFPQKMNDADYSSISTSGNVVLLSNQELKLTPNFLYIGLVCGDNWCQTKISVEWTKEITAIANGEKTIETPKSLNGANSAVVRLTIPKELDTERIVIHVDSRTTSASSLEAFIGQGTSIPFTNKAENVPRKSSWFEGTTMIIDKDSSLFCNGCVLTLSLKFKESSALNIQAETFKKNTPLSGAIMLDAVQNGKENSYRLTGRESHKEEDFILSVKVQQGKVKVYVNCDTQPQSPSDFYWSYLAQNSREITLPSRVRSKCSTENYFLLVHGEDSSVYSLQAAYIQSHQLFMGMGQTAPITSDISPQEKTTFEVLVPIFSAEEILLDFHFSQSLDLNVLSCRFPTDCPGLIPSSSQGQIPNYYGLHGSSSVEKFTFKSEKTSADGLRITINPPESGCNPVIIQTGALPVCAYLVTLSNKQSSVTRYSLITDFKGPNFLPIGESRSGIVTKDKSVYYALYIPQKDIESVQIQLTEFSGDPGILVSRTEKYPNQEEDFTPFIFSYEDLIILEGLPYPSGVYYIGVHAKETSSFSLSAIVKLRIKRNDFDGGQAQSEITEDSAFTLAPGKPQKGVLLPKNQYESQYYKILLNQDEGWEGTLRVTVNSLRGRVLIAANNNGEFPTANKNMWNHKDNDLEISSSDPHFKSQGVYYIGIIFDRSAPDANLLSDLVYHITYSLIDNLPHPTHIFLSPNTPFYGSIKRSKSEHFEALLLVDQSPMTIYKYSDSGKVDIYISTNPDNKYPNQDSYTFTTKNQNKDYITLKACETNICSVYVTVVSSGGHKEVSYSLSVREGSSVQGISPMALGDGRQIQSITPSNNLPAVFYYHAIPSQKSIVTVTCPGREAVIYAKRIKVDIKSLDEPDIEVLDEETAEFTSEEGATYVSVPPLEESYVAMVAISVYFRDTEELETTYTILASTQITQLSTGTPYSGFVAKDHYVYFMVNIIRPECTLLISLTNLEKGDADLVISHGENTRPTTTNHRFAYLSDQRNEVIEINNADISPLKSMSGTWVIGVYGDTSSSFSLSVAYEDQKMVDLKPNVTVEMSLEGSSFVYFKYLLEFERNLQINFTQLSGELNLYITSIDLNQDFLANVPDQTHHKWRVFGAKTPQAVIAIPMQHEKACVSCVYIMNIEAVSSSKFNLVVNQLDNLLPIQIGVQYEGRLRPQKSAVYMLKSFNEDHQPRLNVEMKGSELAIFGSDKPSIDLSNYLWKETLASKGPNQVVPLKKSTSYFLLHNPTTEDLDYSFTVTPKAATMDRIEQIYYLDPEEKKFFQYTWTGKAGVIYETQDKGTFSSTPTEVDVIFYAVQKKGEDKQGPMESYLKQGQTVQALSWPGRSSSEEELLFFAQSAPRGQRNSTHAIVRQKFVGNIPDRKGKYIIEIANPWGFKVGFRFAIVPSSPFRTSIPQGEQMTSGFSFLDVPETSTKWFLWVYSCDIPIDLKIENDGFETGMVTIPKGESYLYKEEIKEATSPNRRDNEMRGFSVRPNNNYEGMQGKFFVYSYQTNEKKFKDHQAKKDNLEIKLSQKALGDEKSQVIATFKPVNLKDSDSSDEIIYQVQLCSESSQYFNEAQYCWYEGGCVDSEVRLPAKQRKTITVDFQDVMNNRYSVKVKAIVIHQGQPIKFVQPYVMSYINVDYLVGDYVKPIPWIVIAVITAAVVIVGFIGLRRLKTYKENKGLELQKMEISSRGYDPLDDDGGHTEDSKNEESKQEN